MIMIIFLQINIPIKWRNNPECKPDIRMDLRYNCPKGAFSVHECSSCMPDEPHAKAGPGSNKRIAGAK